MPASRRGEPSMDRIQKVAVVIAAIGVLLIAVAGFLTARDYFRNGSPVSCPPAAPAAAVPSGPAILDVRSGPGGGPAVIRLRATVCMTVEGIGANPALSIMRAEVDAAGQDLKQTAQLLQGARSKGDAA